MRKRARKKKRTTRRAGTPRTPRRRKPEWVKLSNDDLLGLRLRDLKVTIAGSPLAERIQQVLKELAQRGIRFKPHFWVSSEWFSPDGVPGVAVPFYLTHPRLLRLERKMMVAAEGASHEECMKILRHEVGHAIDHAYRLGRRASWRKRFGNPSRRYPETYIPKPTSKRYVQHLGAWYAQSHPDEDFAETFAVWLTPRSAWRKRYMDWPALRKLEYVDELMGEIASQRPRNTVRAAVDPLSSIKTTLARFYAKKQNDWGVNYPDVYDRDLRRLFSDAPEDRRNQSAAAFIRRIAPEIRSHVSYWTGESEYTLDQVLSEIIDRCAALGLYVSGNLPQLKTNVAIVLTMHTMTYMHKEPRRVLL